MANSNADKIQDYLENLDYPVSRDDLIENAMEQGADPGVVAMIVNLDADEYNSPSDVMSAIKRSQGTSKKK